MSHTRDWLVALGVRPAPAPIYRAWLRTVDGAAAFPRLARLVDGIAPAICVIGLVHGAGAGAFFARHPHGFRAGNTGGVAALSLGPRRPGQGRQTHRQNRQPRSNLAMHYDLPVAGRVCGNLEISPSRL